MARAKLPLLFQICFENYVRKANGWGTWIRTKTNGVRVRCSTLKLSPSRDLHTPPTWRPASATEACTRSRRPPSSELKHRTQHFSLKKNQSDFSYPAIAYFECSDRCEMPCREVSFPSSHIKKPGQRRSGRAMGRLAGRGPACEGGACQIWTV